MKKRLLTLVLTIIVCIFALCSFTSANGEQYLVDPDDIINDADEAEIAAALESAEEFAGVPVRVYAYDYSKHYGYMNVYDYEYEVGKSYYDIALLVISYEYGTYYYELFTYGEAESAISDKEADRILDNDEVYDNIKSGNLKEGIAAYASLAATAIEGNLRPDFMKTLLRSLLIAAIVALIVCVVVFFKYKKKLHAESYPLERYARLELTASADNFITKHVTRVRVNSSSSGGGRSGGGRSGGSRGRR